MTTTTDRPRTLHPDRLEVDLDPAMTGERIGSPSVAGVLRGLVGTLRQPGPVVRELGQVAGDLARILRGTEDLRPSPKDKRFLDPAWTDNPLYARLGQGYVATAASLNRLVDELESSGADWRDVERARFAVNALTGALAPTNMLAGNPAALKRAFDTSGRSLLRGLGHLVGDLRHNGGMPSQTDRTAYQVGVDLAVTPRGGGAPRRGG